MDKNLEGAVGEHLDTVSKYVDLLVEFGIEYGFQLLGALVFLLVGLKVASWIGWRVTKMLEGRNVDVTLSRRRSLLKDAQRVSSATARRRSCC